MQNIVIGIAILLTVVNFDAVVHAEVIGTIPSSGGRYFNRRVEIPVPAFAQDDPRWSSLRLGPSADTLGDEGCAVTSAAMVIAFYGIRTDPRRLNDLLTRAGGFSDASGSIRRFGTISPPSIHDIFRSPQKSYFA